MTGLRVLETYVQRGRRLAAPEAKRCELCAEPIGEPHAHLVDLEQRQVCCACRACAVLFASPATLKPRYRTVPDRVLVDPSFELTESQWTATGIPVRLAFVFFNSSQGVWAAFNPSPAGAVEAELATSGWESLASVTPLIRALEPDVEALLVRSTRAGEPFTCFAAPIDACYELVALVRRHWKGFDGGDIARREIDAFFERISARSRPMRESERQRR